jgi:quinol monooxygenase YgiN
MFARSTTISGDPANIDAGINFIRDVATPQVMAMEGCVGMSLVVDRASGRCIVTACWESEDAMTASEAAVGDIRSQGGQLMGATPQVDIWEVALMHREHTAPEGACCRITWGHAPDLDDALATYRDRILPMIEQTDGFCSASMFLDRASSRLCGTVSFDSMAALEATRELAAERRKSITEMTGMVFDDVAEFDLVVHHLRIPELV